MTARMPNSRFPLDADKEFGEVVASEAKERLPTPAPRRSFVNLVTLSNPARGGRKPQCLGAANRTVRQNPADWNVSFHPKPTRYSFDYIYPEM